MGNLLKLLIRHSFFILFILLELFCFFLIIQNNNYQRSSFLNIFFETSGAIQNQYASITEYLNLKNINEELAKENALLKIHSIESKSKIFGENILINDTIYKQKYVYITCKVINNSVNKATNYLTLNKGAINGIEPEMGVIGPNGIIGIVKHVSPNFCTVVSVLHTNFRASAKVKHTGFFGSLYWNGNDYRTGIVEDIPSHIKIKKGDTIVTTGFSTVFPENINIGTVNTFELPPDKNFYQIKVTFLQDYKNLNNVYVIKNLMKEELLEIEKQTLEE
jgi:rod shape-determining protein MreC